MSTRVLTVILNYRTADMTLRAAQAAQTAMADVPGEIVIVDNDSGDGSEDMLRAGILGWDRTRLIQSGHNGGFGAGNNVGIRAGLSDGTAPDFIYLLNSDAFPEPDAIATLRDYLVANPDCGFVGSRIAGEDGGDHVTAFRFHSARSEFETAAHTGIISKLLRNHIVPMGVPDAPTRVDWCAGASVMFRQATLDQIGLFDEDFFLYFEENRPVPPHCRCGVARHVSAAKPGCACGRGLYRGYAKRPQTRLLVRLALAVFHQARRARLCRADHAGLPGRGRHLDPAPRCRTQRRSHCAIFSARSAGTFMA